MQQRVKPKGLRVADIGYGGGIYSRAWVDLGAEPVIGVESSRVMVEVARANPASAQSLSLMKVRLQKP
ncbi:50S ribosomal protein L11 methyltransferase [Alicyclobacillus sp. SP_1]|uniref:50S ribosomal protein L11 methyltransferase n=1 Tax=Alicyclobacillus sp. SP_1 TaxID=2942475 RepID=UPI0035BE1D47